MELVKINLALTTFIYVLRESDTGEIRYVGKSNVPDRRLVEHLKDDSNSYKCSWIKALRARGAYPVMEIIFECPESDWETWEQLTIKLFLMTGCRLVNLTVGGDGGAGGPNFKGRHHTDETKQALSRALKGRPSARKGVPCTEATKLKMSQKRLTPEHKERISKAGKQSWAEGRHFRPTKNASGVPGITRNTAKNCWVVHLLRPPEKRIYVGQFEALEEAIIARKEAEKALTGTLKTNTI